MRTLTKNLLSRANKPLAASLPLSTGEGLTTEGINKWLANLFSQPATTRKLEQYKASVPVYFAVNIRGDAVARAPMKAYTVKGRNELEELPAADPIQKHLTRVNPWWTHSDLWRGIETYLCLWGSSFRFVDKIGPNPADWEQWLLRPDKVAVVVDKRPGSVNQYIKGFIYDPYGAKFPMLPDEVIWDRYFNPLDEFSGLSPLEPLLQDILPMRQDMIKANRFLFKNGIMSPKFAFMMKGPLTDEGVEQFYARLEERHMGPENAHRPFVVDMGSGSVENLGFNNREMEWSEGVKWAAGDVLTAYGVREELYPGSQRTTYHNLGEALQDFYRNTISSEWELLEAGMNERFRPMLPTRYQNIIFKFDTTVVGAMQESLNEKSNRELMEVRAGALLLDEYRADRGRPPLPDGMGQKSYITGGTQTLGQILGDVGVNINKPAGAGQEPIADEVQALALNGAQVTALLSVIEQVTQKQLAPATAKDLIKASFPLISDSVVSVMVDSAAGFTPAPLAAPQTDPAPRVLEEVRCPDPNCNSITGRRIIQGSFQYCRNCKREFET